MIDNTEDIIDSRDIVERLRELGEAMQEQGGLDEDDGDEFDSLSNLVDTINDYGGDSAEDGVTLIRDSYFTEYAQQLAEDIGAIGNAAAAGWPLYCIDWEQAARELQADYSALEFDGVTYWFR